jgi:hypothetical protein
MRHAPILGGKSGRYPAIAGSTETDRNQKHFLPGSRSEVEMLGWIFLGFVGWVAGFLFLMALMRMASDQERAAHREENLMTFLMSRSRISVTTDSRSRRLERPDPAPRRGFGLKIRNNHA